MSQTRVKCSSLWALGLIATLIGYNPPAHSQSERYNHPELSWKVITTDHFRIIYHPEAEWSARTIATLAEEAWEPLSQLYQYQPEGRVHIIVRDHDDYSNGVTYYYQQKIEIWATPLDFELRGNHHWLRDVVTHELTHLFQLGASRKGPRNLPNIYLQGVSYERERRPDVLYGYPYRLISFPILGTVIPMWFAEGVSQYATSQSKHDWWDSHRDMMIRVRALQGNLLTLSQMEVFGKNSLESELVYCQGYSLVKYIAQRWGEESLRELSRTMRSPLVWDFSASCKKVLGVSDGEIYQEWKRDITEHYRHRSTLIMNSLREGKRVSPGGFANLYPRWSPDGKVLAFISNEGRDYFSQSHLAMYDPEADRVHKIEEVSTSAPFDWSPDGRYIIFSRLSPPNRKGSRFSDLYLWEGVIGKKGHVYRLTQDARLWSPAFSPDGKEVVAVHNSDGTLNLALIDIPDTLTTEKLKKPLSYRIITSFQEGFQLFRPQYSPDGLFIYFSGTHWGNRDLYRWNRATAQVETLLATPYDERDPTPSPDGSLYFSSDQSGIFNIYRWNLNQGTQFSAPMTTFPPDAVPLTNVIGGAFSPTLSQTGALAYALFTNQGYQVAFMPYPQPLNRGNLQYLDEPRFYPFSPPIEPHKGELTPYRLTFDKLFISPRIAWDYESFKPGFYAFTEDILGKVSLEGGAAINRLKDRDLYARIVYRIAHPTLFVEGYNLTRHRQLTFDDPWVIIGERYERDAEGDSVAVPVYDTYSINYTFTLGEVDLGASYPVGAKTDLTLQFRLDNYQAALRFEDGSTFKYTYHKGKAYLLRLETDQRERSAISDIHPKGGWRGWMEYARENNRFLTGFKIDADRFTIQEVYRANNYHHLEGGGERYFSLTDQLVLNPALHFGLLSRSVDPFYHLYAGGLPGLKGYSYFSLGGTRKLVGQVYLRFPIWRNIDRAVSPFHFDQLFGAIFGEVGDSWRGHLSHFSRKRDLGYEVRLRMFSWYGVPTAISFIGAYGLDRFQVSEPGWSIHYGKEWRYYLTILFDFFYPQTRGTRIPQKDFKF